MANEYYVAGDARAERVGDLFAEIAPRYDLINDLQCFGLHRIWKRRLVALACVRPGGLALDLCCGTGDVSFALRRAGAHVVGLDFSGPMLRQASRRAALLDRGSSSPPAFLRGDALSLPFRDDRFEAVSISYGLRNLASVEGGLKEMWRVCKPGGRILVLDFGKPENPVLRSLFFAYLRWFVPGFGRVFCRNAPAYAYILESLLHYPAQRGVAEIMSRLGCPDPRIHNLVGGTMSINVGKKPDPGY